MEKTQRKKRMFLYVNYTPEDKSLGITKKVNSQIRTLRKMNYEVVYSAYIQDGVGIFDNNDSLIYFQKYNLQNKTYQRYIRRFLLINTVTSFFKEVDNNFDYSYLRWHSFDRMYIKMLETMKKSGCKIIVEAHAYTPKMKGNDLPDKYTVFMDKIYSRKAKNYVDLVAGMSEYDNIWGIKTVKIDNAILIEDVRKRVWKKNNDTIRLLSVANEHSYHGFDRLLEGLHNYFQLGGKQKIKLKFVGVYEDGTKELVEKYNLADKVEFYGKKSGEQLDDIYDKSDIGVGALAHHRIGMFAGSSLKTKEYFAKGLPFIYGWKEPKFDDSYPYALRVPLDEKAINIDSLLTFYNKIKDNPNMLNEMREFATKNYSWDSEFNKIFTALEEE